MKMIKNTGRSLALAAAVGIACASPSAMAAELPTLSGLLESLLGPTGILGSNTLAGANVLNSFVNVGTTPALIGADVITTNQKVGSVVDANVLTKNTSTSPTGSSLIGADVIATGASGTLVDANVLSKNASTTSTSTPLIGADVLTSNSGTTGKLVDLNVLSTSDKVPTINPAISVNVLSKNPGTGSVLTISVLSPNNTTGGGTTITPSSTGSFCGGHGWGKRCSAVSSQ